MMLEDASALLAPLAQRHKPLHDALLAEAAADLERVALAAGATLFERGDDADALYVVASGRLRATTGKEHGETVLAAIGPGELVGELGILVGAPRSASVYAAEDAELARLPAPAFERVAARRPEAVEQLAESARRRLRRSQLAAILGRLFGAVDGVTLREVEAQVAWVRLGGGQTLFRQGDEADAVYFVVSGRLRALVEGDDGAERVLNEMAPGESIGEIALLTGEPRTATVRAIRDAELARLDLPAFERLVDRYPRAMMSVARTVVRRLRRSEGSLRRAATATNLALVPAHPDAPLADLARRLAAALASFGPVRHLTAERVGALLGRQGAAETDDDAPFAPRLAAWLDQQESQHRFVVYEADASASPWTRRCVRQADEVLLVAEAARDPALGEVEAALFGPDGSPSSARRSLVLLHPDGSRLPSGTSAWLAARRLDAHYHVRLDTEADVGRLARSLAGRAVGLVLGGGGARGLAHIGVIRALLEAGVPIDHIAGTSMGAVVAGLYGMGHDPEAMVRICRESFLGRKPHKEYTLPLVSLIRSRRLDGLARANYGETRIEDLWLPFFCVSCNLTAAEPVVHADGLLWRAVRASASLPGVFVPVIRDGHLLVDGGVMNNLPGDVMRARARGTVMVVNVSPEQDLALDREEYPSPWQLLWQRLRRSDELARVPSILDVLIRTIVASSIQRAHQVVADADLCFRPPVQRFGLLEFTALHTIVEAGYQHAKAKLHALRGNGALESILRGPTQQAPAAP